MGAFVSIGWTTKDWSSRKFPTMVPGWEKLENASQGADWRWREQERQ